MENLKSTVLNNATEKPSVKEGVDFVFEQNPEISRVGTEEQYSQYLETIFPESKVKDIVYHGTSTIEKETGNKLSEIKNKKGLTARVSGLGNWFSFERGTAQLFAEDALKRFDPEKPKRPTFDDFKKQMVSFSRKYPEVNMRKLYDEEVEWYSDTPYVLPILLNVKKVKYFRDNQSLFDELTRSHNADRGAGGSLMYNWGDTDTLIQEKGNLNYAEYAQWTDKEGSQILVKDEKQIRILGSQKDMEAFKEFIAGHNTPTKLSYS